MSWRRQFAKIGALVRWVKPADDLDEEIRAHLEMEERENRESGMPPEEAHYAALRRFGNVTQAQENSREMWRWQWLETLLQDIRYGLRQLRRNPGFTAVAVLTLALGIGANTAVFSVVNAVLLRPLPFPNSDRLVSVTSTIQRTGSSGSASYPDFLDWRARNHVFDGMAAYRVDNYTLTGGESPLHVNVVVASADLFKVLQAMPALGRSFLPGQGCAQSQETRQYNSRLQPVLMELGNQTNASADYSLTYNYAPSLNPPCSLPQGSGDNGNITGATYTDNVNAGYSHTFTYCYDGVNRLVQAIATGSPAYNLAYSYDQYGNPSCVGGSGGGMCPALSYDLSTNHVTFIGGVPITYDAAGNQLNDQYFAYQYDAEGRVKLSIILPGSVSQCPAAGTPGPWQCPLYNALGQRVEDYQGDGQGNPMTLTYPVDIFGQRTGTFAQWPSQNWTGWNVYWSQIAGQRLNMGGADAYIDHSDAVGSTTMETDPAGAVQWDVTHYPWGRVFQEQGIRQSEVVMGLDWQVNDPAVPSATREFNFRDYRWMTPDPEGGHLENPQTLNKYVYAGNNPTSLNDPSGLDFYLLGGKECGQDSVKCDKGGYVLGANNQRMVVTSASLSDPKSGNKATVSENGVEITAKGLTGNYEGVFINNTPAADIQGSSKLEGFAFHIDSSNLEKGTLDAGTFSFNGTRDEARGILDERGAWRYPTDWRLFGLPSLDERFYHHDSTQHRFGAGPSPHFSVPDEPKDAVPTVGPFHVDRSAGVGHIPCSIPGVACN